MDLSYASSQPQTRLRKNDRPTQREPFYFFLIILRKKLPNTCYTAYQVGIQRFLERGPQITRQINGVVSPQFIKSPLVSRHRASLPSEPETFRPKNAAYNSIYLSLYTAARISRPLDTGRLKSVGTSVRELCILMPIRIDRANPRYKRRKFLHIVSYYIAPTIRWNFEVHSSPSTPILIILSWYKNRYRQVARTQDAGDACYTVGM